MKKTLPLLLLAALVSYIVAAKAQAPLDERSESVLEKIASYYESGLDEKLYLQLDKPYYSSGDKIWFKGYLRNAITHTPLKKSNFIYVELIDQSDKLISRVKVKRDSTGFNGYLTLDPEMSPGNYTLRGYSRWMLNQDEAYFFSRSIKIISPIPETAEAKESDSTRRERRLAEKEAAEAATKINDYSVQFFPEGGALLANNLQIIAFKAIGNDGLGIDVTGQIFNSTGEVVRDFESQHQGMGSVALIASAGEKYYAITKNSEGFEQRFELPAVETSGSVINARVSGGRLSYQAKSLNDGSILDAQFIIHSHGRVISVSSLQTSLTKAIPMDQLFDGVNVISLINAEGKIISERLIFKRPALVPTVDASTSRKNYGRREKAKVKFNVLDSFGQAATGEFGVAVTDNSAVKFNSGDENIFSYLLLSSDLHGYIESPGQYFTGDQKIADRNLDLLMMTQGWRRFDLEKILRGEVPTNEISAEEGASISGVIKDYHDSEDRKPEIVVMCPSINYFDSFTLSDNKFNLIGLEMPDSSIYVIQSRAPRQGKTPTLKIDPERFAEPRATIAPRTEKAYIPIAFVNQSQEKFYYDGGMELINMDAVVVTTTVTETNVSSHATLGTGREKLDQYPGLSLPALIYQFPGMTVSQDSVFYRYSETPARFIVDGMDMEYSDITYFSAADFEKIEFYSDIAALQYGNSPGGVFVIELRQGSSIGSEREKSPGTAFVSQLGYQKPDRFYQPAYEVAANRRELPPDFRTTIYWNGGLTPDEKGNIEFEFYTADKPTTYTVTLEGVTDEGEICRSTSQISRTADR